MWPDPAVCGWRGCRLMLRSVMGCHRDLGPGSWERDRVDGIGGSRPMSTAWAHPSVPVHAAHREETHQLQQHQTTLRARDRTKPSLITEETRESALAFKQDAPSTGCGRGCVRAGIEGSPVGIERSRESSAVRLSRSFVVSLPGQCWPGSSARGVLVSKRLASAIPDCSCLVLLIAKRSRPIHPTPRPATVPVGQGQDAVSPPRPA
jgi:hypothetical protein